MKVVTPAVAFPSLQATLRELGSNLRKARQARGWTMAEAAERVMVSLNTYKRLESGDPKVAFGTWVLSWQRLDMLESVVEATSPAKDKVGQAWRAIHAVKRVRKAAQQDDDYDF